MKEIVFSPNFLKSLKVFAKKFYSFYDVKD